MQGRKKRVFLVAAWCYFLSCFITPYVVEASNENLESSNYTNQSIVDFEDSLKYDEIQDAIDDINVSGLNGEKFSFKAYVDGFVSGEKKLSLATVFSDVSKYFFGQLNKEKNSIVQLIAIAIVAAVFTSFTNVFKSSHIAETGFYVTYLLMFTLLTATFCKISALAASTLHSLLDFMKALIPTYFMGIAFCSGTRTSMVFYETTLFLITLVDVLLIKVLLPLINVYFILMLANNIMKEDMLSKMAELLENIISWSLKSVLAAVIGFNVIQGLIVPLSDQVKRSVLLKTAHAVPGVGNAIGSVTESVFAAGLLIKNSIGVAGLIIIVVICLTPLIKLVLYQLIYKFGASIVQPISDKRIINCINGTAKSAKLLTSVVVISSVLFLFTIVIITTSTNTGVGI